MSTAVLTPPRVEARRAKPVKWWACVGAGFLALLVYAWASWLIGGDAQPTPTGIDEVPTWKVVTARSWEILFGGWALAAIYGFLVRPWRQGRGLTLDGMLLIAWFTLWALQDPWLSYVRGWFAYNAEFVNLGCPQCHVPGWQDAGAQANLPERSSSWLGCTSASSRPRCCSCAGSCVPRRAAGRDWGRWA